MLPNFGTILKGWSRVWGNEYHVIFSAKLKNMISTETRSAASIVGIEKTIELIAKAGFDAFDLSLLSMVKYDWQQKVALPSDDPFAGKDYLAHARKLKQIARDNGIVCNQSHAPYPSYCKEIRDSFYRAIEITAEVGGEICVIHPDNFKSVEENAELYFPLLDFAKQHNVKIAAENMWTWVRGKGTVPAACSDGKDFLAHLRAVNDDFLVACLDIGHAEMTGLNTSACTMIDELGDHLKCIHLHDNDFLNDSHQIPFSMKIDLESVAKALHRNNYGGYITLEAVSYLKDFQPCDVEKGLCDLAMSAKRFEAMMR